MRTKLVILFFCTLAAFLLVNAGYGLWEERLTIKGHITVVRPEFETETILKEKSTGKPELGPGFETATPGAITADGTSPGAIGNQAVPEGTAGTDSITEGAATTDGGRTGGAAEGTATTGYGGTGGAAEGTATIGGRITENTSEGAVTTEGDDTKNIAAAENDIETGNREKNDADIAVVEQARTEGYSIESVKTENVANSSAGQ